MGLFRTVSEINGDFSRKSQNFPTPVYFAPPLKGFPLEFGIGAKSQKTRMMWVPDSRKFFKDRFSRLDTIPGVSQTDRQTDRQTDTL